MKTSCKISFGLSVLLVGFTFLSSCSSSNDPAPINEGELITTVRITFIPQGGGDTVIFESVDADADGPAEPSMSITGTITSFTSYEGSVEFTNELEDPVDNVTEEILTEDEDHQIFYTLSGGSGSTVSYNDTDSNGNPLGLSIVFETGNPAPNNFFTLTLRHSPNKFAEGVSDGNLVNAGGDTDVEVTFNYDVEL